jgi:hypothetical protein
LSLPLGLHLLKTWWNSICRRQWRLKVVFLLVLIIFEELLLQERQVLHKSLRVALKPLCDPTRHSLLSHYRSPGAWLREARQSAGFAGDFRH